MKPLKNFLKDVSASGLRWCLLLSFTLALDASAQEKISVQVKTFDQQLSPYRNIDVSVNDKEYVAMGAKGVAFIDLTDADLPVKTIKIKNEQLEAASWNYSKGTLEIIVRNKSYQISRVIVKDENNTSLINQKVTFRGRRTMTLTTDREGRIEIPLALDEKISLATQFSIDGFTTSRLTPSGSETILIATRIKPLTPLTETPIAVTPKVTRSFFKDFNLSKLDSIQSLTVFYAIFKNYDRKNLSAADLERVDAKFNELVVKLESAVQPQGGLASIIGKINDSTFIADDIKTLIAQARKEGQTLTEQRIEFDQKLKVINDKLAGGFSNMSDATRKKLLDDLTLLERILVENESRFYKNQSDYRELINSIKEKYFNIEDLENKLSASEVQRIEEQRVFRQRLIIISSLVLIFGVLIVLLIYFSNSLRKQKKELEAANAEIKRINENLEGLVYDRTRLLEESNKELDTFLYRASHDMRTPVKSILGLCNIAGLMSQGEPKELVDRIATTTNNMDKLLKKLSVISEINQPSNYSSVTLLETIEQIEYSFKKVIQENKVQFVIDCPADLIIYSYPNLIETILSNVTENALYYGSMKNSTHRVEISASIKNDSVVIQILDNGIGVDASVLNRLFDMFFKGSELSKGNGLGLYIVQKAVQALDGKVSVESSLEEFTRFTIVLPLKPETPRLKKEAFMLTEV